MSDPITADRTDTDRTDTDRTDRDRADQPSANGQLVAGQAPMLLAADLVPKRRRWPYFLVGVAVGGVGAAAVASAVGDGQAVPAVELEQVAVATVAVVEGDLLEEIEWEGTLGYGDAITVPGAGGIVTSSLPAGATIARGDVIATVDDDPVVALFGDTPMWRGLSVGSEGIDVLQLEKNLAVLGYDPDQSVDIDETYTSNTAAMVERWQEDLGIEITGEVADGAVVIVDGPSSIVSAAEVGTSASGVLATIAPRWTVTDVVATIDGVVDSMAAVGTEVEHGSVLFRVDDDAVVALVDLDAVARTMVSRTFTAVELEQALADGGYDPAGEMTVDGVITDATTAAIERWQAATGLPVSGQSDPGHYVEVPAGRRVEAQLVTAGDDIVAGGPILTTSTSRLSAEVVVEVGDADEFEVGQEVSIELADGTTVPGSVAALGAVVAPADPQAEATVDVTFDVVVDAGRDVIEGTVTIVSIGEEIRGATIVPTRALVSLAEGGFAVERATPDGSTELVGVELGAFDDGVVQIVDGDIAPGDEVVVPR